VLGTKAKDLIFTASATVGTVQLFINNRVTPSSPQSGTFPDYPQLVHNPDGTTYVNNSMWSSETAFGGERIVIAANDPNYKSNAPYVVGVLSTSEGN